MDLTGMNPAEIDTLWLEAMQPANKLFERAVALQRQATKYRNAGGHYVAQADRYDEEAEEMRTKYRAMRAEVEGPFEAEWKNRSGWTRAYLVPDGHIHRSTACHTLYPTTLISWVPALSGHSEDEIVEYAGTMACTVCYPSAPVEALRAAEQAEKRKGECPGSRTHDHDSSGLRYASPRAKCNHCHRTVSVTSTGMMRAHKPERKS